MTNLLGSNRNNIYLFIGTTNTPFYKSMAKKIKLSDSELVTQHIQKLEPSLGKIIEPSEKLF